MLPVKSIPSVINSQVGLDLWPYSEQDPFWVGGRSPRYYRWRHVINVTPQRHSNNQTTIPYEFNGYDVNVGDWIASISSGLALQIVSIEKKNRYELTVITEDVNRYNTLQSTGASANGAIGVGMSVIFALDNEGEPILTSTSIGTFSSRARDNLEARFQSFNTENNVRLHKVAHGFQIGDLISASPSTNTFVKATETTATIVGHVSMVGPGPDYFYITPKQKVLTDFDSLIGNEGDLIYVDSVGNLTTSATTREVYVKLRNNTKTFSRSSSPGVSTTPGYAFSINSTLVTVLGSGSMADVIQAINLTSSTTNVTATDDGGYLKIEADDARALLLRNVTGSPLEMLQITSSENGIKAAAMIVEKAVSFSSSGIAVVPTIEARDQLTPILGTLAYVADSGNSEWGMFVWNDMWVTVGNQDSARSDADSLQVSIFDTSSASTLVGTLSTNSRVTLVTVEVVVPFDGNSELSIGDVDDFSRLMDSSMIDLTEPGIYSAQSEHLYNTGSDTNVFAYFSQSGSQTGQAIVTISYM